MTPTRIRLQGFLSYVDETIDLSGLHTVAIVGPVGSGKTAIIEALCWAIWRESRAETLDELIGDDCDHATVTVDLQTESGPLTITRERYRGRDGVLTLLSEDEILTGHTSMETQAEILRRVGMTYEEALAGPLMVQSGEGSFMDLSPKDRKSLLFRMVAGAGRWEARAEKAKEVAAAAKTEAGVKSGTITALSSHLIDIPEHERMLEEAERDHAQETHHVESLRSAHADLTAQRAVAAAEAAVAVDAGAALALARIEFQSAKASLQRAVEAQERAKAACDAMQVDIPAGIEPSLLEEAERAYEAAQDAFDKASREDARMHEHVQGARNREEFTCPKCGTTFRPGISEEEIDALRVAAQAAFAAVEQAGGVRSEAAAHRQSLYTQQHAHGEWERKSLRAEQEHTAAVIDASMARDKATNVAERGRVLKAEVDGAEGLVEKVHDIDRRVAESTSILRAAEDRLNGVQQFVAEQRAVVDQAHKTAAQIVALSAEVTDAEARFRTHKVLAEAFGRDGIPTMLLEAALPRLEAAANDVLGKMPGGMAIRLVTQKATQKGTSRERLDVVVETENGTERGYKMLSGGQRFRVDIALRMALADLSESPMDFLVFDEGLDRYQDDAGRDAVLDTLAAIAPDFGRVLVVSHNPDVISRIDQRIEVTITEGVSHARVA